MRTPGQTLRGNEMDIPNVTLESVKAWAKAAFTREKIADAVVCVSTVTVLGMVLKVLYTALENRTVVGL